MRNYGKSSQPVFRSRSGGPEVTPAVPYSKTFPSGFWYFSAASEMALRTAGDAIAAGIGVSCKVLRGCKLRCESFTREYAPIEGIKGSDQVGEYKE